MVWRTYDIQNNEKDYRYLRKGLVQTGKSFGVLMKIEYFLGHSLPSADSRRAVVSFWRKNVHNTG